jgi:regulator of replication initiation timing
MSTESTETPLREPANWEDIGGELLKSLPSVYDIFLGSLPVSYKSYNTEELVRKVAQYVKDQTLPRDREIAELKALLKEAMDNNTRLTDEGMNLRFAMIEIERTVSKVHREPFSDFRKEHVDSIVYQIRKLKADYRLKAGLS